MAKSFSEQLAINEATELKRNDIFLITQDGSSAGIRSSIIESTINAVIIRSQDDFNNTIERVGANQYKFKSEITAMIFKKITGGYKVYGGTSFLSGGDTWGYIQTNLCGRIYFETGAYIDAGQTQMYLHLNTSNSRYYNIIIKGDTGAAAPIERTFLIAANNITLINCESQTRLSNTNFVVFQSNSISFQDTTKINGCKVIDCNSSGNVTGFRYMNNIEYCTISDITADNITGIQQLDKCNNIIIEKLNATGNVVGCSQVNKCNNIHMEEFDGAVITGLSLCNYCTNITMQDFDSTTGDIRGIFNSKYISNIVITDLQAGGNCYGIDDAIIISNCEIIQLDAVGNCYAFSESYYISSCSASDIDSSGANAAGYYDCSYIGQSNVNDVDASGTAYGYSNCNFINSTRAANCDYGFYASSYISTSNAINNSIDGYFNCERCSTSFANGNTNHGYNACNRMSSCTAGSNGVDGYNNCDTVIGCQSANNTGDGYQNCNHIEHNVASANGGAAYNNCFADLAATRAAAATDAGGDNA